ncbi:MAG: hypothetical protein WKF34_04820 [Pyrinomonadaceae bacterium]
MTLRRTISYVLLSLVSAISMAGQTTQSSDRRITKTDRFDFGAGGSVTITGAPSGSIRVVGGSKSEVEIVAEIEISSANGADFAKLGDVTGFLANNDNVRATISSIGSHNKFGLKKLPKNFPKHLLAVPYRVNYTITVPHYTDVEVEGGRGDFSISGVEGALSVNLIESKADIEITSGAATVTIGTGTANVSFGAKGWRGRAASIQVAKGDLNVRLPINASANVSAVVLRTGAIENNISDLKPLDRTVPFSAKSIAAKSGVGGPPLKFVVGDGVLRLARL